MSHRGLWFLKVQSVFVGALFQALKATGLFRNDTRTHSSSWKYLKLGFRELRNRCRGLCTTAVFWLKPRNFVEIKYRGRRWVQTYLGTGALFDFAGKKSEREGERECEREEKRKEKRSSALAELETVSVRCRYFPWIFQRDILSPIAGERVSARPLRRHVTVSSFCVGQNHRGIGLEQVFHRTILARENFYHEGRVTCASYADR